MYLYLFGLFFLSCGQNIHNFAFNSPNGEIIVNIFEEENHINYNVLYKNKYVIAKSKLGLIFKNGSTFPDQRFSKSFDLDFYSSVWELPWGETRKIKNQFNQAKITFKNHQNIKMGNILFRVYNDGIAFRYQLDAAISNGDSLIISDEITEFTLAEDAQSWWIPAYTENRYEHLYRNTKVSQIDTVHTPFTVRYGDNTHLSFHEADLKNYSSMQIFSENNILNCDLAPWPNGDKVRMELPSESPWRTIIIAKEAKDLISSNLTLNCNEPSLVKDPSWIKPSKYIGIWWGMILGKWTWGEGPRHGATNQRAQEYIDFASEHGFNEVLIEGWSSGWKGLFPKDSVTISFTKSTPDIDLYFLRDYAKTKNVSLQLYHETSGGTKNYLNQIDSAFSFLNKLGVANVKIGHVGAKLDKKYYHYSQYGVSYFRKVLQKALEYKIGVNFHEPIKDTGERRTYPNMLTREGARGMEYNAWPGGNPPNHTLILPFTRLLGSTMDFTPGIFDLLLENIDNHNNDEFPVTITVIDSGNGYTNLRFKSSESIWIDKKMNFTMDYVDGKEVKTWTIKENFQAGEWEWGVTADLPDLGKNNIWVIESLSDKENRDLSINILGNITGENVIKIPFQDLNKANPDFVKGYPASPVQRVRTTISKQLALYVIINSPLQMASDFIENYKDHTALEFIKEVPVIWDTTIVLNGEIEKYLTIARKDRKSKDWYIGSISNEDSRSFELGLSFLEEGVYQASIYSDSKQTDLEEKPDLYDFTRKVLTIRDTLKVNMTGGGGQAIQLIYLDKHTDF
ncbi:MAG: alpha-glucosidase [Candidatus Marinimicrobia bacterium]|nr:alpha-glucosidase [Candidatus Neomarinimicrobiota bacterium]